MTSLSLINRLTLTSCLVICTASLMLTSCTDPKKTETTTTTSTSTAGGSTTSPAPGTTDGSRNPPSGAEANTDLARPERAGSNPIQLLQNPKIKSELQLTDDQVAKIKAVETDLLAQVTTAGKSIKEKNKAIEALPKDKQEGEKKKLADDIEKGLLALTKDSQGKMNQILKPEQQKRAKEILLQKFDFGIVTKDDFATELKLTDAQKKQLNDIVGQMRTKTIGAWEIPDKEDASKRDKTLSDNRKRMEAVMKESNQHAKAVLTPDQLKTLETLKGKPVSFSLADLK
jgi:Spy/CpxP family protein refolding chaperone